MKKVAVVLAGCGQFDGSEIQESVLTLLSLDLAGAEYQCYSVDSGQYQVINHLSNNAVNDSKGRNMLQESSRISRGNIKPLKLINVDNYDALIIPGGNGVAANLFTLAQDGKDFIVNHVLAKVALDFTLKCKPVSFICISSMMIPVIYPFAVNMTIGNDTNLAKMAVDLGAIHQVTDVDDICVDDKYKIITTPAYMLAQSISEVYVGISKLVAKVVELA